MGKDLNIYFSNHLDILYQHFKNSLFQTSSNAFTKRVVVVYGPAMKSWLMLKMAQDPDLNIAVGIEFIYLNQAFEKLLSTFQAQPSQSIPSLLELTLWIEKEIILQLELFDTLGEDNQQNWLPLIRYLKLNPQKLSTPLNLSKKMERRLIGLSQQTARHFQDYGRYAESLTAKWNAHRPASWQEHLWSLLFHETSTWQPLFKALQQPLQHQSNCHIHFFSISFLSRIEFNFIQQLSLHAPVNYYMISPCAVFWSDIRSDKESHYLLDYWEKKLGQTDNQLVQLEDLLCDRNPLLANFGRMGREMTSQIEESQAKIHADYLLASSTQQFPTDQIFSDDLHYFPTDQPLSLIQAVQADMLLMRNPHNEQPFIIDCDDTSIQLHRAPNKRREVEIIYHNLLALMQKHPDLEPRDIIVMAPKIVDYVPYIQQQFGAQASQLFCQILDLGLQTQSEIVQGFIHLIEMSETRWDVSQLMQLFELSAFQRKHQFSPSDYQLIQQWVGEAGIRWGEDSTHRNDLLQRRHCSKGMVEETHVGTWDFGFSRLLMGLTYFFDPHANSNLDTFPCKPIDFTEVELLGKWMRIMHALRDDLLPLHDGTKLTIEDWTNYLTCLLENYFQPDLNQTQSLEEFKDLQIQLEILRRSAKTFNETLFPFQSVKIRLNELLEQRGMVYRENYVQSVRFCSLIPLRSIPAKVIVLMGMQEGVFPRVSEHSSLNLMMGKIEADYAPSSIDYDRYLFLEALHSAHDYLLIHYQGFDARDSKELKPSLVVEELFSYLDRYYRLAEHKPSEKCFYKHPLNAFDQQYFVKNSPLFNFSQTDFATAQIIYNGIKQPAHLFVKNFNCFENLLEEIFANGSVIDLKNLYAVAKDPIKFHLNKILGIYLQNTEDRLLKNDEELSLSALDRYLLKREGLKESTEEVFQRAEKGGRLPLGLFKTVALNKLKKEIDRLHQRLHSEELHFSQMMQIEFCTSCYEPTQIEKNSWLLPAITLTYPNHYQLRLIGQLTHITSKGLFVIDEDHSLESLWKTWPHFLALQYAANMIPKVVGRNLILSDSKNIKTPLFDDPEPVLKQFMRYFALCQTQFSPLMPKWLTFFKNKNADGLQKELQKVFDSFGGYPNPTLQWIFNKDHLPVAEELIENWSPEVERLTTNITP